MASRRTSTASVKDSKHRKHSTDRYQRQAELSLRIEERRVTRPPLVREEDISVSYLENFFKDPQYDEPNSLTRADTGPCPLEIHPGQRVRGLPASVRFSSDKEPGGQFVKPFDEPDEDQQQKIKHRQTNLSQHGSSLADPEHAQSQIQRLASDAKDQDGFLRRIYNGIRGRKAIKPGAFSGLEYAASLATAHAHAVLSQTQDPLHKRRMVYVLEYSIGGLYRHDSTPPTSLDPGGMFSCAPPLPFDRVSSLKQYLEESTSTSNLRLIYTCNNEEAINYLSGAFGISNANTEASERSFRDWMQTHQDTRRASHKAIRWRPAFDSARGVICSAFGVDFGSVLVPQLDSASTTSANSSLTESTNSPRISMYMQRSTTAAVPGPRVTRFNTGSNRLHEHTKRDTIIICESSCSGIGEVISIASLLGLGIESKTTDASQTSTYALESVILHLLEGIVRLWQNQIDMLHEPHAELEDYIWSQPADSSRARDVWKMSQRLHAMVKLINRHAKVIEAVQDDFRAFAERTEEQLWMANILDELEGLSETIRTDYLDPLEHMIDLMYKSVTIRDSRQSLDLNASLWRLSWITFIFLPLTFLVGAFGMNVDVLRNFPSIKWYFVAVVPLLAVIFIFWFTFRRFSPGSRNPDFSAAEVRGLHHMRPLLDRRKRGRDVLN